MWFQTCLKSQTRSVKGHMQKKYSIFQQYCLVVKHTNSVMRQTHNHGKGIDTHTKILSLLKTGVLQWVSYHSEGAVRQIYQQNKSPNIMSAEHLFN